MFFDTVEDLHSKFKLFDRLNTLVFGIWKDKSALEYRDGALQDLRILYMNYINEMRQQCNELEQLNKEVAGVLKEVQDNLTKIDVIASNPSIQGCGIVFATGYTDMNVDDEGRVSYSGYTTRQVVIGRDDITDSESYARRETGLYECKAHLAGML